MGSVNHWDPYFVYIWDISERQQNIRYLRKLFSRFGEISDIEFMEKARAAKIRFTECESASKALQQTRLHGIYIEKCRLFNSLTLDCLNYDCLFHIYSYLSVNDLSNLSEANDRQKKIYQVYENTKANRELQNFLQIINDITDKISNIFEFLGDGPNEVRFRKSTEHVALLYLRPEEGHDIKVFKRTKPQINTITMNLFNFAYLQPDESYIIEANYPNLETLEIYCNTKKTLLKLERAKKFILKKSRLLKLNEPDFFLEKFSSEAEIREQIKSKLVCLEKQVEGLEELGEIDSLKKFNCAVKYFEDIYVLTDNTDCVIFSDPGLKKNANMPLTPYFMYNFKHLSESNLGKHLKLLEIDLDFFGITDEHMKYLSKLQYLKFLKVRCRPFILESKDFLEAMKRLVRFNNLKVLEFDIKLSDDSDGKWLDDPEKCCERFYLETKKMFGHNYFKPKKLLALELRFLISNQDDSINEFFIYVCSHC